MIVRARHAFESSRRRQCRSSDQSRTTFPKTAPCVTRRNPMKAAWYEKQGPAREVLVVGDMPDPIPAAGEVRIRIAASGINPGDIKKREDALGYGMPYPRVIPHSDGAGR